ncbi:ssDNA endodeoxyribonuclease [Sticta canariensis]|nr:ssDNA endodeoxyribonuclease [Sticta canariensis]
MESRDAGERPVFTAVSSSARQLFQLLRCISFAPKAQVQISNEGLRFTVEESRVMQGLMTMICKHRDHTDVLLGLAFLEKSLFTTYIYAPPVNLVNEEEAEAPAFQISLSSLLETLQIFGINDVKDRWSNRDQAYGGVAGSFVRGDPAATFGNRPLGMNGMCRLSYHESGDPFCITLEEGGVTTICELVTYEPEFEEDIPLQLDALAHKVIMRASWLYDAINELSSTSPTRLTIVASPTAPYFTLSSNGPLGSAMVEFGKSPELLETFQVPRRTVNTYKFSLIKAASKAMAIASKVSIRGDEQGVLSLQFLIEVDGGGVSFVDFHFVPFELEEGEGDEESPVADEDGLE